MSNLCKPTAAECDATAKVYEDNHRVGYAMWYPQMGGYGGISVAVIDKKWEEFGSSRMGGCVDVYVWHDGEFPFSDDRTPTIIHHCDPMQFVRFGETLERLNNQGREIVDRLSATDKVDYET